MALVSKEWIEEFHEAEGHGLDPAPLVEAALLAHELLEASSALLGRIDQITTEDFSRGGEKPEREALRRVIERATGAGSGLVNG